MSGCRDADRLGLAEVVSGKLIKKIYLCHVLTIKYYGLELEAGIGLD